MNDSENPSLPGWYLDQDKKSFTYFDGNRILEELGTYTPRRIGSVQFYVGPQSKPHSVQVNLLRFVMFIFIMVLLASIVGFFSGFLNLNISDATLEGIGRIVSLTYLSWLGTRVGYRWFDALFALIPFYNFYYLGKILWRNANLPHRYWNITRDQQS